VFKENIPGQSHHHPSQQLPQHHTTSSNSSSPTTAAALSTVKSALAALQVGQMSLNQLIALQVSWSACRFSIKLP